jgi:dihydropyrimidinase
MQVMATAHCPFFYYGTTPILYEGQPVAIPGKELGKDDFTKIPNGLPGVGDRMPIIWTEGVGTGRMTPNQFVAMHCTNPARIFGLYPQKGALIPGADADIALWDPNKAVTYGANVARHRTDYSLYEGWQLKGFPVKVFLRGKMIVDGENWYGSPGSGRYLHRQEGEILQ